MEAETRSVQVRISGRVQGVGYRAWMRQQAIRLGLSGWVKNLPNGDVEALLCGPSQAVEQMLAACRKGPRFAEVVALEVGEAELPLSEDFAIRS
jgi:acylphosphatase